MLPIPLSAFTAGDMTECLSQEAAPILSIDRHLFFNFLFTKKIIEKFFKTKINEINKKIKKIDSDIKEMPDLVSTLEKDRKELIKDKIKWNKRFKKIDIKQTRPSEINMEKIVGLYDYNENISLEAFVQSSFRAFFAFTDFEEKWLIFEIKHEKNFNGVGGYLLIPINYIKRKNELLKSKNINLLNYNIETILQFKEVILEVLGFNSKILIYKKLQDMLKMKIESEEYPTYSSNCKIFEQGTLNIINGVVNKTSILSPWTIYWGGHGNPDPNILIGGLSLNTRNDEGAVIQLITMLEEKGTRFLNITSCYAAGINMKRIQSYLSKFGKKLIVSIGALTDLPVTVAFPQPPNKKAIQREFAKNEENNKFLNKKYLNNIIFPYYSSKRLDEFFKGIEFYINPFNLETKIPTLKEVFKHLIIYNINSDSYDANTIPYIKFPSSTSFFSVIGIDNKIQSINQTTIQTKKLEKQLRHLDNIPPILIQNKDIVIISPEIIDVPLKIIGTTTPVFIFLKGGNISCFFDEIQADNIKISDFLYSMLAGNKLIDLTGLPYKQLIFIKSLIGKDQNLKNVFLERIGKTEGLFPLLCFYTYDESIDLLTKFYITGAGFSKTKNEDEQVKLKIKKILEENKNLNSLKLTRV